MERVTIDFEDVEAGVGTRRVRRFVVKGEGPEPFASAAREAIGDLPEADRLCLVATGPSGPLAVRVTDKCSLAEVARFTGEEVLPLAAPRIGGQWILDLKTLIEDGLTLYGVLQAVRGTTRGVELLRFRKHREAIKRWALSGPDAVPDAELVRLMKAENMWSQAVVEKKLGLSRTEAGRLFKHLGYSYGSDWDSWFEDPTP